MKITDTTFISFALFSPMLNAAPVTIKIAYESNPWRASGYISEALGRTCERKSNGDIVFELYPSSQLGR